MRTKRAFPPPEKAARFLAAAFLFAGPLAAAARDMRVDELADLSLEQLSNVVVTSVSRQEEPLSRAATSIFVISASDIRRAGAHSIPEALRLAPNLQVARVDARNYAITARGFSTVLENKMLVLIDGRSIYSPLFSGVFWDAQDVVMEDVERIEVISGPGASIWGANAVNGVINIITRSARDTQGGLATASGSGRERTGAARYGGRLANGGSYRVYGKYAEADDTPTESGIPSGTGWHRRQGGFRTDWENGARAYTAQGDVYAGRLRQYGTSDIRIGGANLLGRMSQRLANGSSLRLQTYWDHTERDQPGAFIEHLDTLDLELQQGAAPGGPHSLTWGGGYRHARDRVEKNGPNFVFLPGSLGMHWGNLFAQDDIALRDDLRLTLGLKLEHNGYTGLEKLPTARLAWMPDEKRFLWASFSRTVRAPSRIDRDLYAPAYPEIKNGAPDYFLSGGPDFVSETANVLEAGYRAQPFAAVSYSASAFYTKYDRLRTVESQPDSGLVIANMAEGRTRGVEMWTTLNATPIWRLSAGLVEQRIDTRLKPGSTDITGATGIATNDPKRYAMIRSSHDLPDNLLLDMTLRYVGSLPTPYVPAYHELNMRLGWRPLPNLELAVAGNNLLHASHVEFPAMKPGGSSLIERSYSLEVTYRFE